MLISTKAMWQMFLLNVLLCAFGGGFPCAHHLVANAFPRTKRCKQRTWPGYPFETVGLDMLPFASSDALMFVNDSCHCWFSDLIMWHICHTQTAMFHTTEPHSYGTPLAATTTLAASHGSRTAVANGKGIVVLMPRGSCQCSAANHSAR